MFYQMPILDITNRIKVTVSYRYAKYTFDLGEIW
jgi:hypothetical protein